MTDLHKPLQQYIAEQTGHDAQVRNLTRIPGGFSYETWTFDASWKDDSGPHSARLILRRAPRGGVLEPYDASKEFRILRSLEGSEVPVPRALWVDASGSVLGTSFYVMEHVEGEIPSPFDKKLAADTRTEMHRAYTDTLAALHTVDWTAKGLDFLGVPENENDPAALELDRCTEVLDRIALRPYPALREVIEWLREHRPRCPQLALVHDDYRMGNFIWREGRIVALLDWERAFIGDPMADVAFSRLEALAGWCSIRGEMAERYAQRSGIQIDEERVSYYATLESLKATLVGLTGLHAFAEGRTSDLRLVQIGRGGHHGIPGLTKAIGLGR
jgi:aminoglycoside phosphotransferase (APT) family kinase protein